MITISPPPLMPPNLAKAWIYWRSTALLLVTIVFSLIVTMYYFLARTVALFIFALLATAGFVRAKFHCSEAMPFVDKPKPADLEMK